MKDKDLEIEELTGADAYRGIPLSVLGMLATALDSDDELRELLKPKLPDYPPIPPFFAEPPPLPAPESASWHPSTGIMASSLAAILTVSAFFLAGGEDLGAARGPALRPAEVMQASMASAPARRVVEAPRSSPVAIAAESAPPATETATATREPRAEVVSPPAAPRPHVAAIAPVKLPAPEVLEAPPPSQAPAVRAYIQAPTIVTDDPPPMTAWIQLAATRSDESARESKTALGKRFGTIIDPEDLAIVVEDYGSKGVYHYIRLPARDMDAAKATCAELQEAGSDCYAGKDGD